MKKLLAFIFLSLTVYGCSDNNKIEVKMISRMKKGSRIMITGYNKNGSQTIDHYSLLGFTKAYNASKKACK